MGNSGKNDELKIIAGRRRKNSPVFKNNSKKKPAQRKTYNILQMNILTLLMYLSSLAIVALATAILPKILALSDVLSGSNYFYEGYLIAINSLVVLIYILWGYWMGNHISRNARLFKVMLSFSVITIGNLLLMLFLTLLGLTASGGATGFEWMVYIGVNYAYMPFMDLFMRDENLPNLMYMGYLLIALIPVIFMTLGAQWRRKKK